MLKRIAIVLWWIGASILALTAYGAFDHHKRVEDCARIFAAQGGLKKLQITKVPQNGLDVLLSSESAPINTPTAGKLVTDPAILAQLNGTSDSTPATYEVKTQDGSIYHVTAPAGATQEQALAFAQQQIATECESEKNKDGDWILGGIAALTFLIAAYILGGSFIRPPMAK